MAQQLAAQDGPRPALDVLLPIMTREHSDAFDLSLVVLDEEDMFFQRLAVFPAMQGRRVDNQADLPLLPDEFVDLRRDRKAKSPAFNFVGGVILIVSGERVSTASR